jgi:hypothetical protein
MYGPYGYYGVLVGAAAIYVRTVQTVHPPGPSGSDIIIDPCKLSAGLWPLLHWPHEKTDWEKNHARDRSCFA